MNGRSDTEEDPRWWMDVMGRVGYSTKGGIYALVGVLAILAALDEGGQTTGSRGALREIAGRGYGQAILWAVAVGLFLYAAWRGFEAIADPKQRGSDVKGIVQRAGYGFSSLMHVGLCVYTVWLLLGGGSGGSGGITPWVADLMAQPFGRVVVSLMGAVIVGAGAYQLRKAYRGEFVDELYSSQALSSERRRILLRVGQAGFSARGVVYGIIGGLVVRAAWNASPGQARGTGGALRLVESQDYGTLLLIVTASGLVAYAAHCVARARWGRFRTA